MIVLVTALKDFEYGGRKRRAGELVSMSAVEASIAGRKGQVSLDRGVNARTLAASNGDEPDPPKRRYRRRDMQAEA